MKLFSSKDLRNFYYKWFRPDLQAVFVVGDINLEQMETKVKSTFATLPKPLKSEKREYYTPNKLDKLSVVLESDPEYNKTTVSINILQEPLKQQYKNTIVQIGRAHV